MFITGSQRSAQLSLAITIEHTLWLKATTGDNNGLIDKVADTTEHRLSTRWQGTMPWKHTYANQRADMKQWVFAVGHAIVQLYWCQIMIGKNWAEHQMFTKRQDWRIPLTHALIVVLFHGCQTSSRWQHGQQAQESCKKTRDCNQTPDCLTSSCTNGEQQNAAGQEQECCANYKERLQVGGEPLFPEIWGFTQWNLSYSKVAVFIGYLCFFTL